MYKYILQSVDGIEWFAITSLVIFFVTFCVAAIRVALASKRDIDYMSKLPLDD